MKATISISIAVVDDMGNINFEREILQDGKEGSEDEIYSELFNLTAQLQYDIVEASGRDVDYFL